MSTPMQAPAPMSQGRYRALLAVLVVGAVVALIAGIVLTDTTDPDDKTQSEFVEHLIPPRDVEVLRQTELGIDLAPGFDGTLAVNGIAIPVEEQRRVPEQNQVFFTPGDGKAVEQLLAGRNCVTATVWQAADGPGTPKDRTVEWCFEAT